MKEGFRILSAYPIDPAESCKGFGENTLWITRETFLKQRESSGQYRAMIYVVSGIVGIQRDM